MGFWNIAGVRGRDEEFWKRIKEWDVEGLVETWLKSKNWEGMKRNIPVEFSWWMQEARRERKRGRAAGKIIMEIKKSLEEKVEVVEKEGMVIREVNWKGERWRVGTVYIRENMERVLKREKVDERRGEKGWIIGGDFNARTGQEGAIENRKKGVERRSIDKTTNRQGETLLK